MRPARMAEAERDFAPIHPAARCLVSGVFSLSPGNWRKFFLQFGLLF